MQKMQTVRPDFILLYSIIGFEKERGEKLYFVKSAVENCKKEHNFVLAAEHLLNQCRFHIQNPKKSHR